MTLVQEKVRQAVQLLDEFDLDCWVTFVRESEINGDPMLAYVLGAHVTWPSAFIICRDGRTHAVVGEGDRQTVQDLGVYGNVVSYVREYRDTLARLMAGLAPRSIALNYSEGSEIADGLTHGMFLTLRDVLASVGLERRIVPAERLVASLRGRKADAEIDAIRRAIHAALEVFEVARAALRPPITERAVAALMHAAAARRGLPLAWAADTCPAVFAGPEARDLHARPGERPIAAGQIVYVDFGVRCDGYCSDLQRVYYVGDGSGVVPADVQRGFDTLVEAIERARRAMTVGACGVDVDRAARDHITACGYAEFPHALGHQVGRFAHDGSAILGPMWEKYGRKPTEPLEPGMVFTIEPRLYVEGRGTVSIEEMVVVTRAGAEFLSPPQTRLMVV